MTQLVFVLMHPDASNSSPVRNRGDDSESAAAPYIYIRWSPNKETMELQTAQTEGLHGDNALIK